MLNLPKLKYPYSEGVKISYKFGVPIGFSMILIAIILGEGLWTILMLSTYGYSILSLIVSFLLALGVGGYYAVKSVTNNDSLLLTSVKYSFSINAIIWSTFAITTFVSNSDEFRLLLLIPPILLFAVCVILSSVTISLLISYAIKRSIIYDKKL